MSLKKLGRYDLLRVLGKGAMGVVYEGRDPNLDRRVAIKTVKVENLSEQAAAEYESRFRTEARSAARLQHPNIVSVYDSNRDGDIAYLVMEYVQGDDLKHHLDKGVRYSLEQSLKMVRDLLSALDYAHKQSIIHRDVKPANLMIEPGGRVKLTDFGVARIQDSGEVTRTQGGMVGTLKYMSPEQVQGLPIDSRADLFSAGVVLYQLLTDKRPFDGDNDFSIIHQIIGQEPKPPSTFNAGLPPAIDAVVARALAKDRDQRFATARDFAVALQSAMRRASDSTVVPPTDPFKRASGATQGTQDAGTSGTAASIASATSGTSNTSATSSSTATVTQELELVYWKDIKDSTDPDELSGFLAKFPTGIYADLAQRRLKKLASGADLSTVGLASGPADAQDFEATRLRSDYAPQPASTALPSAPSVAKPSPLPAAAPEAPSTTAGPPPATPTPTAPTSAPAAPPALPPEPVAPQVPSPQAGPVAATGKNKMPLLLGAGVGVVLLLGAAFFALRGDGSASSAAASSPSPLPAASTSQADASSALTPAVLPASAASAASVASAALRPASAAASRPVRAASRAVRASVSAAPVASTPVVVPQEPAKTTPLREPASIAKPPAAAASPRAACESKIFIAYQLCLTEQCALAQFQTHPICVERREQERRRQESQNH